MLVDQLQAATTAWETAAAKLAEMEKVTTQSMSQILRHLAEGGYIERRPSATDRRKVHIAISDAGRQLQAAAAQGRHAGIRRQGRSR